MNENKIRDHSNSKDRLLLEKDGETAIIHKYMDNSSGRATKNVEKQMRFNESFDTLTELSSVPVEFIDSKNDTIHVKMPYIEGTTGYDFATTGSRIVGRNLASILDRYIIFSLVNSKNQQISKSVFEIKLEEIGRAPGANRWRKCLDEFKGELVKAPEFISIPIGTCHGDLTMSNIIYTSSGHSYLIDFLDTYLETPLQDVAKLIQDFDFGWTFRRLDDNERLRAAIFRRAFRPNVIDFVKNTYPLQLDIITKLCLLRIIPYVTDESTENWLNKSLEGIFNV
jgi:hypothetical protein